MGSEQAKTWKLRTPRQAGETCWLSQPEESVIRNGWISSAPARALHPAAAHGPASRGMTRFTDLGKRRRLCDMQRFVLLAAVIALTACCWCPSAAWAATPAETASATNSATPGTELAHAIS